MLYFLHERKKKPRLPSESVEIRMEEKRRFPRIEIHTPLRYQVRGTPEFNNATTDNISIGGLGFVNEEFIAPENGLTLEVSILSRLLNSTARVVWSSPLPHSNRYRVGVEFLELEEQGKKYLQDFIDLQMNKL